jgi:uridine phosphorylase
MPCSRIIYNDGMENNYPILQYDPSVEAIIEPYGPSIEGGTPGKVVLCFFQDILSKFYSEGLLHIVAYLGSEIGKNPIYEMIHQGQRLLVVHPGVGAPLAAAFMDELISIGAHQFVVCGGCVVINREIAAGHLVIVTEAVRDEGTSYHYLSPGREVAATLRVSSQIEKVVQRHHLPYLLGKSWTTDGFYRETAARRERRVEEGCSVVEMEGAAFFAVAKFRGVECGMLLYGGDLVVPEGWDGREWHKRADDRELLLWLAVETVLEL